jgi:hypothetical protein
MEVSQGISFPAITINISNQIKDSGQEPIEVT